MNWIRYSNKKEDNVLKNERAWFARKQNEVLSRKDGTAKPADNKEERNKLIKTNIDLQRVLCSSGKSKGCRKGRLTINKVNLDSRCPRYRFDPESLFSSNDLKKCSVSSTRKPYANSIGKFISNPRGKLLNEGSLLNPDKTISKLINIEPQSSTSYPTSEKKSILKTFNRNDHTSKGPAEYMSYRNDPFFYKHGDLAEVSSITNERVVKGGETTKRFSTKIDSYSHHDSRYSNRECEPIAKVPCYTDVDKVGCSKEFFMYDSPGGLPFSTPKSVTFEKPWFLKEDSNFESKDVDDNESFFKQNRSDADRWRLPMSNAIELTPKKNPRSSGRMFDEFKHSTLSDDSSSCESEDVINLDVSTSGDNNVSTAAHQLNISTIKKEIENFDSGLFRYSEKDDFSIKPLANSAKSNASLNANRNFTDFDGTSNHTLAFYKEMNNCNVKKEVITPSVFSHAKPGLQFSHVEGDPCMTNRIADTVSDFFKLGSQMMSTLNSHQTVSLTRRSLEEVHTVSPHMMNNNNNNNNNNNFDSNAANIKQFHDICSSIEKKNNCLNSFSESPNKKNSQEIPIALSDCLENKNKPITKSRESYQSFSFQFTDCLKNNFAPSPIQNKIKSDAKNSIVVESACQTVGTTTSDAQCQVNLLPKKLIDVSLSPIRHREPNFPDILASPDKLLIKDVVDMSVVSQEIKNFSPLFIDRKRSPDTMSRLNENASKVHYLPASHVASTCCCPSFVVFGTHSSLGMPGNSINVFQSCHCCCCNTILKAECSEGHHCFQKVDRMSILNSDFSLKSSEKMFKESSCRGKDDEKFYDNKTVVITKNENDITKINGVVNVTDDPELDHSKTICSVAAIPHDLEHSQFFDVADPILEIDSQTSSMYGSPLK